MPLEKAAAAVMSVWTENMVQAIADITVNQGIDPAQAAIIGGGGAAGLNANAIAARLNCHTLIVPEVGAALSAYGAAVSDIAREYRRIFVTSTMDFDSEGASKVIAELKKLANTFASSAGSDPEDVRIQYTVEARYHHQVWEIDVAVDIDRLLAEGGVKNLEERFHRAHEQIFAFRDPDSPVESSPGGLQSVPRWARIPILLCRIAVPAGATHDDEPTSCQSAGPRCQCSNSEISRLAKRSKVQRLSNPRSPPSSSSPARRSRARSPAISCLNRTR